MSRGKGGGDGLMLLLGILFFPIMVLYYAVTDKRYWWNK